MKKKQTHYLMLDIENISHLEETMKVFLNKLGIKQSDEYDLYTGTGSDASVFELDEEVYVRYCIDQIDKDEIKHNTLVHIGFQKVHMQYDFNKNIMYGFYTLSELAVTVNGEQNDQMFRTFDTFIEVHNEMHNQ